jgi:hypothetical protein
MTISPQVESALLPGTQARPTTWHGVQAGLWVGQRNGEYAGMIERHRGEGYAATSRLGESVGLFSTMEEALTALR